MLDWAVVGIYILAVFLFNRHDVSGAGYTAQLLARWFPQLSAAELRQYVWFLRKVGHVLAYGVLTYLVHRAALKTKGLRGARCSLPCSLRCWWRGRMRAIKGACSTAAGLGAMWPWMPWA